MNNTVQLRFLHHDKLSKKSYLFAIKAKDMAFINKCFNNDKKKLLVYSNKKWQLATMIDLKHVDDEQYQQYCELMIKPLNTHHQDHHKPTTHQVNDEKKKPNYHRKFIIKK